MAVFVIKPKQRGDDASSLYFFQCSLLFKIRKFYKKVEISDEIRICSRKHEIRTNFIHQRKTAIIKTFWGNVNLFDWKFTIFFSCLSVSRYQRIIPRCLMSALSSQVRAGIRNKTQRKTVQSQIGLAYLESKQTGLIGTFLINKMEHGCMSRLSRSDEVLSLSLHLTSLGNSSSFGRLRSEKSFCLSRTIFR